MVSHVVLQAGEFPSIALAERCTNELQTLIHAYAAFENSDHNPWDRQRVAPPLLAFGNRHGIVWPNDKSSQFLIRGNFEDDVEVFCVGRVVFFWADGFHLGGDTLRAVFSQLGAITTVGEGDCHILIRHEDPDTRAAELLEFLREEEDYDVPFLVLHNTPPPETAYASLTLIGPHHRVSLVFDDSGAQDGAFTALLPQLSEENPSLLRPGR